MDKRFFLPLYNLLIVNFEKKESIIFLKKYY